ncbi:DUF484 family protein [Aliivibrio finisterrensis]|uniref:DUF484 family protein n=1 Tax=Aliivibrio finisterrensis TaxID=511998 RepID=UPI00101E9475|nr:DUF484 family protein [Aliivibrio finisterrensis]RYU66700.1 DUF484 family protein [Aliivibrio finisterrensis]RYU69768.1 DUF484 family protein [Aliivibrio finisterrensis]RYU73556.1 DUF484 family protein [Aliivibrio finisterrensis]
MNDVTPIEPQPTQITEDVVAQFLMDHPDFFQQYPELLGRIKVDTPERGVVSLVEVQVSKLRARIGDLEEEITQLMSLAAKNDRLFHDFANVQKQLLMCENFSQAAKIIELKALSLDLTAHIKIIDHSHPKYHIDKIALDNFSKKFLNGHSAYLGRLRQAERDNLLAYGGLNQSSAELGSFAVLPLGQSTPMGIIAFASHDGGHFEPNMDTLFLEQLVSVFHYLLMQWSKYSHE